MTMYATVTAAPTIAAGNGVTPTPNWVPNQGSEYKVVPAGDYAVVGPIGAATVKGFTPPNGMVVQNWGLATDGTDWYVSGNGLPPAIANYKLVKPLITSGALANTLNAPGPIGLGTVGAEIAIVIVIIVVIAVIAFVLHTRK